MRGVHALEYTYSFGLLSDMLPILGPVKHLLMVVCVHFAVALLTCPRVWCILTPQPTPLTLGWLETFRSSLMTVISMVEIINVLGFGRADDGSAPNLARVLPVSPVMPNKSLLIDRRACAGELFSMVYEERCAAETVFKVDLEMVAPCLKGINLRTGDRVWCASSPQAAPARCSWCDSWRQAGVPL